MYLLDTNVISELYRARPNPDVLKWFSEVKRFDEKIFISVLSFGEMQNGVLRLSKKDSLQAELLKVKFQFLAEQYAEFILPVDKTVAFEWGRLLAIDKTVPIDALLAAQANVYRLTLVTRNVKHITSFAISYFNPFV